MAIQFDESTDYYVIPDAASMTLPNSDWCVGIWTNVADNAGPDFQYLLSNNGFAASNSFNFYLIEDGETNPAKWALTISGNPTLRSTSAPGGDGADRLLIVQRVGSTVYIHFCEFGQASVQEASAALTAAVNGGVWHIGSRVDTNSTRFYGGIAGEFFKGNFSLSVEEITALGAGMSIWQLGYTPDIYQPMTSDQATMVDIIGSNDMTRNGTPATVEHFPIIMPGPTYIHAVPDVGGGATIPLFYNHYQRLMTR